VIVSIAGEAIRVESVLVAAFDLDY